MTCADCIAQANTQALSTIEFSPGLTGTIDLGSGLVISSNVTIIGPGAPSLAVEGGGPNSSFSVFSVDSGATVSITGLTVKNGYASYGGGVMNEGTLTLTNDTVSGNAASQAGTGGGGVFNGQNATATLIADTFAGNALITAHVRLQGGGVFNLGAATLSYDLFLDNTTANGGWGAGMSNMGTATLSGDTFIGNSALDGNGGALQDWGGTTLTGDTFIGNSGYMGGAMYSANYDILNDDTFIGNSGYYGGAIDYNGGDGLPINMTDDTFSGNSAIFGGAVELESVAGGADLISCTITGNSAIYGGGVGNAYSDVTLTNDTIVANSATDGGGLLLGATGFPFYFQLFGSYASAVLDNTIVAGNSSGGDIDHAGFGNVSGSHDLIGDGSSLSSLASSFMGNPLLAPLDHYGGPTMTMALLPGSPAIDAGSATIPDVTVPTTDQRGLPRVGGVDLGAFESQGFTLTPNPGSTPQSTTLQRPFANPLGVSVTADNPAEPINGGIVSFAAPDSGASATLSATTATISDGTTSVLATDKGTPGSFSVIATDPAATQASFSLISSVLTFTVTNADDSGSFSGLSGDLRYCINQANAQGAQAVSEIQFSPGFTGTITLGSGFVIDTNLTIIGPGASLLTLEGGGPSSSISSAFLRGHCGEGQHLRADDREQLFRRGFAVFRRRRKPWQSGA